ncbi:MAG: hypothetical protein II974_04220 [Firmicutes bacterium]|nr:hypothetical protein [Bacillota bacterium]
MKTALLLNCISHLLVDGTCVAGLFQKASAPHFLYAVLIYDTLAFATQCLVGLWVDKREDRSRLEALSMAVVCLSLFIPNALFRAAAAGVGNSVFHVCAGTVTLEHAEGKAGSLGLFVAPGAFGVTIGTLQPKTAPVFAGLLALAALLVLVSGERASSHWKKPVAACSQERLSAEDQPYGEIPGEGELLSDASLCAILLTGAVAVRAIGGSVVVFPWKTGPAQAMLLTLFVFLGKSLGGFFVDRLGERRTALISLPLCAVCIVFFTASMPLSLLGQLLLNLTMPVTLWLLYRIMPDDPGAAFGLAASALWPGTLIGALIPLAGPAAGALTLLCISFALYAILFSVKEAERTGPPRKGRETI